MEVDNEADEDDHYESRPSLPPPYPGVVDEAFLSRTGPPPTFNMYRGYRPANVVVNPPRQEPVFQRPQPPRPGTFPVQNDRTMEPPMVVNLNGTAQARDIRPGWTEAAQQRRPRGFGQQPVIEESSHSPPRSDAASNRSAGTNQSNGAGFFRTYQEVAGPTSPISNGALTPDLNFAEIGHGRGAVNGGAAQPGPSFAVPTYARRGGPGDPIDGAASHGITQVIQASGPQAGFANAPVRHNPLLTAGINPFGINYPPPIYSQYATTTTPTAARTARNIQEPNPTVRDHRTSVQTPQSQLQPPTTRPPDSSESEEGRGRSVKRFKNTLTAAEQYASSFFFGRGNSHEGGSGSGSGMGLKGR
jgi:F-box and leucine-rich repeat protein GRR1